MVHDKLMFSATIDKTLMSYLDGETLILSPTHAANAVSVSPTSSSRTDRSLLHQRLCHLGADQLEQLIKDVHGPMQVGGHQMNCLWWGTFVDNSTQWMEVFDMYQKSDMFEAFKIFKARVEHQTGEKIKCLHHNKGGKYMSKTFLKFCEDEGICLEFTNAATPQQNGVVEHLNRTIEEVITSMLVEANLPESFWMRMLSVLTNTFTITVPPLPYHTT